MSHVKVGEWYYQIERQKVGLVTEELDANEQGLRCYLLIDEKGQEFEADEYHLEPLAEDDFKHYGL